MSTTIHVPDHPINPSKFKACIEAVERESCLLQTDETFTVAELPGKWNTSDRQEALKILSQYNALTCAGYVDGEPDTTFKVYKWNNKIRSALETYLSNRTAFSDYLKDGCDCRPHIHHTTDGYSCRYCGQEYSREQMQRVEL